MSKSAVVPDRDAEIEADPIPTDPNAIVELNIVDRANAGRMPSSRWGRVKFDEQGLATIKVPLKDVTLVHGLRWLSVEDQEKYLGLSQESNAVIAATTSEMAELQAQLDAARGANMRLASRNAELEAKFDEFMARYQREYADFKASVEAAMSAKDAAISELTSTNLSLFARNTELEAQIESLTAPMASPAPTLLPGPGEKSGKPSKSGK